MLDSVYVVWEGIDEWFGFGVGPVVSDVCPFAFVSGVWL